MSSQLIMELRNRNPKYQLDIEFAINAFASALGLTVVKENIISPKLAVFQTYGGNEPRIFYRVTRQDDFYYLERVENNEQAAV